MHPLAIILLCLAFTAAILFLSGVLRTLVARRIRNAETARYAKNATVGFRRDPRVVQKIDERIQRNYRQAVEAGFTPFVGFIYLIVIIAVAGILLYGATWIISAAWGA